MIKAVLRHSYRLHLKAHNIPVCFAELNTHQMNGTAHGPVFVRISHVPNLLKGVFGRRFFHDIEFEIESIRS